MFTRLALDDLATGSKLVEIVRPPMSLPDSTQDKAGFLGPIRYNPIRFSLPWMAAETGVFRDARFSVVRSLEAAFR